MNWAWMAGMWCVCVVAAAAQSHRLPVFLSDNHAESFAWMTRTFELDQPLWLVLVDAHTDASAAERSEEMREQVRRVPSLAVRAEQIETWRATGRLQAFNWIEPLMPRPIEQVIWVPKMELTTDEAEIMSADAMAALDGRLEVEPRGAGSFAKRWQTMSARELERWEPGGLKRIVLSIDLDFFAGMAAADQAIAMEAIWRRAMDWPGLAGVCFAVSRPWLRDDAEADSLVRLATALVARTRGAELEMDASVDDRPDDSVRAGEHAGAPPRWDAATASPEVMALWWNMRGRLRVKDRLRDWREVIHEPGLQIEADEGEMDCDGVWRFDVPDAPVLRVRGAHDGTGRVRWFALRSARKSYDFLPQTGLGKDFSESPGRWVYEERHDFGETRDFALAPEAWASGGPGRVSLDAEVETARGWLPVPAIKIRLMQGRGFLRGLSECFNMPYGFGIAMVEEQDLEAVETGWAADCSNALIHAWRRSGVPMRWGDPGNLRGQLESLAEHVTTDTHVEIAPEQVGRGVMVDFGRHVAALWEDREPVGLLDGGDLFFHHLGGYPEIVPLSELAETRRVFSVRTLPEPTRRIALKFAGDVVLAGDERIVIDGFGKSEADLFLVNLEGVPSMMHPEQPGRYDFRFPPERLAWLKERGVDAVSLANNHAGDAGSEGLVQGLAALRESGLGIFGAGRNEAEACQPWRSVVNGKTLAVFGVCLVDGWVARANAPGVAHLPTHELQLRDAMREAGGDGATLVVFMHGGDEYHDAVNEAQRRWARWLVHNGARVVVGAHPHVMQRNEMHGGSVVTYSLGNAVYPATLKGADSGMVKTIFIHH